MKATTRALAAAAAAALAGAAVADDRCRPGYVWREAHAGDHVCVVPQSRADAQRDNREAATRVQPGGGAYGPNTCKPGFVWRAAKPDDLVCVPPAVRDRTAAENADAPKHRVVAAPAGAAPAAGAGYQTSAWSAWKRASGVEYRYRWGWDPGDRRYAKDLDALYEIRSTQDEVWHGAVRSIECNSNALGRSRNVDLKPREAKAVSFPTPNCGSAADPWFKPNVVRSSSY